MQFLAGLAANKSIQDRAFGFIKDAISTGQIGQSFRTNVANPTMRFLGYQPIGSMKKKSYSMRVQQAKMSKGKSRILLKKLKRREIQQQDDGIEGDESEKVLKTAVGSLKKKKSKK